MNYGELTKNPRRPKIQNCPKILLRSLPQHSFDQKEDHNRKNQQKQSDIPSM